MSQNALYYGDNLQVLREHIKDESIDLIYLDPPFNSQANYNVLFRGATGERSKAQIEAFEDTWHWTDEAERAFDDVMRGGNTDVAEMLRAMRLFLKENDMMAYLTMMAARLLELHRVLRPTGSIYLHCDPTASHYLKILLDSIFGPSQYLNEIIWKRSHSHNSAKRYGPIHDVIFFYSKTGKYMWNGPRKNYSDEYVDKFFKFDDNDGRGRYWTGDLTGNGVRHGDTGKEWRGFNPTDKGRHWMVPPEELDSLDLGNRIYWPKTPGAWPKLKRYLLEAKGIPLQDIFDDIYGLATMGGPKGERLGYPTQKPVSLLERIVEASSQSGDTVLDPFCGCGTTIHAAQKMGRKWIGIDITHLAISLIEKRLKDAFPGIEYTIHGTPKDLEGARALAQQDKYQFQWWAVSLVDAVPYGGKKRGADSGIDGHIYFKADAKTTEKAIVSVKGGDNVNVAMIRDLAHVVEREKAKIGVFITLAEPTGPMKTEAVKAGFYKPPYGKECPRIQILTIRELFEGKQPQIPLVDTSAFKAARRESNGEQTDLF